MLATKYPPAEGAGTPIASSRDCSTFLPAQCTIGGPRGEMRKRPGDYQIAVGLKSRVRFCPARKIKPASRSQRVGLKASVQARANRFRMRQRNHPDACMPFLERERVVCLLPTVLFVIAAALGDTGGPLFWLLISVPLALIGLALGLWVHAEFRSPR